MHTVSSVPAVAGNNRRRIHYPRNRQGVSDSRRASHLRKQQRLRLPNPRLCEISGHARAVPALELAFATEKATRVSIVTTLSEEQVNTIRIFAENSRSPAELRRASMTMLALRMGLRSVDTVTCGCPTSRRSLGRYLSFNKKPGCH